MKFKSQVYTQASGSIGGVTYSHNLGGMYTRARAIPVNPNTPAQIARRTVVGDLANHWVNTLTAAQRQEWATYASNVLLPDPLGEPRKIPPLAHYIRSNSLRMLAGLARRDDGPAIMDLGNFTNPVITLVNATLDQVTFTLTTGDPWNVSGGGVLLFSSRGQNPTINFFKGPYLFATSLLGPGVGSPQTKDLAFSVVAGQRVFFAFRFCQSDGRVAQPFRCLFLASTP